MVKFEEVIRKIRDCGGIWKENLKSSYHFDCKHSKYNRSFNNWCVGWLKNNYNLSNYMARKVADYYNLW
jgi:hypothetical protein